jgi:hypothetical protein
MPSLERLLIPGSSELPECRCGKEMQVAGVGELSNLSVVKTFGTICGEIERRIWRIC